MRNLALCLIFALAMAPLALAARRSPPPGIDVATAADRAVIFAEGTISTPDEELSGTFSPDMTEFYFTKSAPNYTEWFHTIVVSRFVNGAWTRPQVVSFSGRYADSSPHMAPDGRRLYFGSNRPVDGVPKSTPEDSDIWYVDRASNGRWGEPHHLGSNVNSPWRDSHPSVTSDGTLYFQSSRPRGAAPSSDIANLYRSRLVNGEYQEAADLGDVINTAQFEMDPFIARDESYLIFGSTAGAGGSGPNLLISHNQNGQWTTPINLGAKVNGGPSGATGGFVVSIEGRPYLFFNSASGRTIRRQFERPQRRLEYAELEQVFRSVEYGRRNFYYVAWSALALPGP